MAENPNVEINASLERLKSDFPNPGSVAFIIMRFGAGPIYGQILGVIQSTLQSKGIVGVTADQKKYHSDPYWNNMTYMHGCGLGVAIFENFENQGFDPNVALEVGYMQGLGKEVCLLENRASRNFPTALNGKLHRTFDTDAVDSTVREAILEWLSDLGLGSDGAP